MSYLPPQGPPPSYDATFSKSPKIQESQSDSSIYEDDDEDQLPMTAEQQAEEAVKENAFLDESLRTIAKPLHQTSSYPRLPRIIAIPQIAIGSKMKPPNPIERAYPPSLDAYDITSSDFMKMLDTINVCLGPSPPFQVLQLASMGIGFVPSEWAIGVSLGLGVLAGAGTAATCYFRTKRCLEKMRDEIWMPRGLQCTLIKDGELLQALGISEEQAWQLMPESRGDAPFGLAKRRFQALSPYIAPLDFNVPGQSEQSNFLDKLTAKQREHTIAKKSRKDKKRAHKREEKLQKTARKYNRTADKLEALDAAWDSDKSSIDSDVESILSLEDEMKKLDEKNAKDERKKVEKIRGASSDKKRREYEEKLGENRKDYEKERAKLERKLEKRTRKGNKRERKMDKKQDKERKKVAALRWIIIRNREDATSTSSS